MTEKEKNEIRKNLLKEHWVEDRHHILEELPIEDSKEIVEAFEDYEIDLNVNVRQSQEDYIADYLKFLWEISEESFWNHVKTSINTEVGLLWSDNMFYFDQLCEIKIPSDVLQVVLEFAINGENNSGQDNELIGCIIKAQVNNHSRMSEIEGFISFLNEDERESATKIISELIKCKCSYH